MSGGPGSVRQEQWSVGLRDDIARDVAKRTVQEQAVVAVCQDDEVRVMCSCHLQ